MKQFLTILTCCVMILTALPAAAESAEPEKTPGQWLDEMLNKAGSWLDNAAEEINRASDEAAARTEQQLDALKQSEGYKSAKAFITDTWKSISEGAGQLWNSISDGLDALKKDSDLMDQVLSVGGTTLIREGALEYADTVEALAAEHQAQIPETLQASLDKLRQSVADLQENNKTEFDETALEGFLRDIGMDKEAFEKVYGARLKLRMLKVAVEAENAALTEYMAEKGVNFSSAALRAQDRLNRAAAGTLSLSEDELDKAYNILKNWFDQSGLDENELVSRIMKKLDTAKAQ